MILEKELERRLRQKLKALGKGIQCLKFESPGCVGVPDRIILMPHGRTIFVELKRPGKKERVRQDYMQAILRSLGYTVYSSVDSFDYVELIVDHCKEVLRREGF